MCALYGMVLLTIVFAFPSFAGQWIQDSIGWWYQNDDGSWPAATWSWIDGNKDGIAECYYFNPDGYMASNCEIDGSMLNSDGQWTVSGVIQTKAVSGQLSGGLQIYEGVAGNPEKVDGQWIYEGSIYIYDASQDTGEDGIWSGMVEATSGKYYFDDATLITYKEDVGELSFHKNGMSTTQWLEYYNQNRPYWMILSIKVKGNHVEEITGPSSIC